MNNAIDVAIEQGISIYDALPQIYKDKREHFPNKIIKFYPMNINSLKCIESDGIYLNEPSNFNDPYDCFLWANKDDFLKEYVLQRINPGKNNVLQSEYDTILHSVTYDTDKKLMLKQPVMFSSAIIDVSWKNEYIQKIYKEAKYIFEKSLCKLRKQESVRGQP